MDSIRGFIRIDGGDPAGAGHQLGGLSSFGSNDINSGKFIPLRNAQNN